MTLATGKFQSTPPEARWLTLISETKLFYATIGCYVHLQSYGGILHITPIHKDIKFNHNKISSTPATIQSKKGGEPWYALISTNYCQRSNRIVSPDVAIVADVNVQHHDLIRNRGLLIPTRA
ncbi:unnamed protein product [Aspergillus oryzae]|nr:unnamed protein product [Aspergillus oryzae]GMF94266.1 unnamed protein product [Aspergillus oryzae]